MGEVVCFTCLTPYHVFVSYILSKTVYLNDYKILILSDHHEIVKKASESSSSLNIWDEIILINEKNKSLDSVQQQLTNIDFNNINILHYFSWGSTLGLNILNDVPDKTKIILTDEGMGTYYIKEACENWIKRCHLEKNPIDFDRISEIWLFDKRLYVSNLNKPLKDIEFKKYLDSDLKFELCNELNILFNYKHEKEDWDILFFDQYLAPDIPASYIEEKYLLMNIIKTAKDFRLLIKKHPIQSYDRYDGLDVNIIKCNVPWEIIYLNEYIGNKSQMQNKIFMTYDSSAMLNTCIIFKDFDINNHFISLSKLLKNFIGEMDISIILGKYYHKFKEYYGENYYEIGSFPELKHMLNHLSEK